MPSAMPNEGALPRRPIWSTRAIDVREPVEGASGTTAATSYKDAVTLGGTVEDLSIAEIVSSGYKANDEVVKIEMLGTPYTHTIAREWRLEFGGDSYVVKRVMRLDQYTVHLHAKRLV